MQARTRGRRRARRGLAAAVVALALIGAAGARATEGGARRAAGAMATDAAVVDGVLARAEAAERAAEVRLDAAADAAARSRAARQVQRDRLADLGLTERTVDARVIDSLANTELVEHRRQRATDQLDREVRDIGGLRDCLVLARRAVNEAFHTSVASAPHAPSPSEVCRALMAAPPA